MGRARNNAELQSLEKLAKVQIVSILNERNPVFPGLEEMFYSPTSRIETLDADQTTEQNLNIYGIREVKRLHTGIQDVFGQIYSQMGFEDLISKTRKDNQWNEILKQVVISRIFEPSSKRRTSQETLIDMSEEIALEKIYRMMDRLVEHEQAIKARICQSSMSLLDFTVDILFFDVTTLYFESFDEDELRRFGLSKDCKFKETQIVLALVTNDQGVPITYELFPGNQYEGGTLIEIVKK